MSESSDKPKVFFMVAVLAFAIILVDDRWVRVGLGLLPALLLARRALGGAGIGGAGDAPPTTVERRQNPSVRDQIQELLKHIREFYTTCHMVAVGQLEPAKAKAKAQEVEGRLNTMMTEMIEQVEAMAPSE